MSAGGGAVAGKAQRSGGMDQALAKNPAYVAQFTPIRMSISRRQRVSPDDKTISDESLAQRTVQLIQCMENTLGRNQAATASVRWCLV